VAVLPEARSLNGFLSFWSLCCAVRCVETGLGRRQSSHALGLRGAIPVVPHSKTAIFPLT